MKSSVVVLVASLAVRLLFLEPVSSVEIRGRVKLRKAGSSSNIGGVRVTCYDQDDGSADDLLGRGYTSSSGSFSINYKKRTSFFNSWDPSLGGSSKNPDMYCQIAGTTTTLSFTTTIKQDRTQNSATDWGTITVYPKRTVGTINGCGTDLFRDVDGVSLDIVPDFFFTNDCNNHDRCYEDCNESKRDCDNEFYALLRSRCRKRYGDGLRKSLCYLYADGAATFLDTSIGRDAYDAAQSGCRRRVLRGKQDN